VVDKCAELGGQPYMVLESLKELYNTTNNRKLYALDTQQGFHEKSDCTMPKFLPLVRRQPQSYASFVQRNPEWTQVITTNSCKIFRTNLAQKIIPQIVEPLIKLSEDTSLEIQKEAFKLLQENNQQRLFGKTINKPEDIEIRIKTQEGKTPIFADELLNKAADKALIYWKKEVDNIKSLNPRNNKKYHKGFMAEMLKATQETKAFTYALTRTHHPHRLTEMQQLPDLNTRISNSINSRSVKPHDLHDLRNHSYLFSDTKMSKSSETWEHSESIQALRMTNLWPWALQDKLVEEARQLLDSSHKNTADHSYLELYTNNLPELTTPEDSLFIILTHDGPLINQFLASYTGIEENFFHPDQNTPKKSIFCPSAIHKKLGLSKRQPAEYTHQVAWIGSEFIRFAYKEALAEIKPYISKAENEKLFELINANATGKNDQTLQAMQQTIKEQENIPQTLKTALGNLIEQTYKLEEFVRRDIQNRGKAAKSANYEYRQKILLNKRAELQIC